MVSVNETVSGDVVSVYPNPSEGNFTIQVDNRQYTVDRNSRVKIHDMLGQLVYAETFTGNQKEINLKGKKGVYQLMVGSEVRNIYRKIIIQ